MRCPQWPPGGLADTVVMPSPMPAQGTGNPQDSHDVPVPCDPQGTGFAPGRRLLSLSSDPDPWRPIIPDCPDLTGALVRELHLRHRVRVIRCPRRQSCAECPGRWPTKKNRPQKRSG